MILAHILKTFLVEIGQVSHNRSDPVQGNFAQKTTPTPLEPPYDPTHRPTVGS